MLLRCSRRGLHTLLIANRGEIAQRITRAAAESEIKTVALKVPGDEAALHVASADEAVVVPSYLATSEIVDAAVRSKCDAIHPGYGFLSESAELARMCEDAGIQFIGPRSETIALLGDKVAARALAQSVGVPTAAGTAKPCADPAAVRDAMATEGLLYPIFLKAVGGGGGRGMRIVESDAHLDKIFETCSREAAVGGNVDGLFVESMVQSARHIEVQLLGDGDGNLVHLFERDCSVQRNRQKMVEASPALGLHPETRERLFEYALRIGNACGYRSAGTCEFLIPGSAPSGGAAAAAAAAPVFLEFNPRIQVEHTVTEEATGIDLITAQLRIALEGATLPSLQLTQERIRLVNGGAMQARIAMTKPGGRIQALSEPGGHGVRVDSALYSGYTPNGSYDPLLLKIIARGDGGGGGGGGADADAVASSRGWELARRRLLRAVNELHLGDEVQTNVDDVMRVLTSDTFRKGEWDTCMLDNEDEASSAGATTTTRAPAAVAAAAAGSSSRSSAKTSATSANEPPRPAPHGCEWVYAPLDGQVLDASDAARQGDGVVMGGSLLVLSSMKMEHIVPSPSDGVLMDVIVRPGEHVRRGQAVALIQHGEQSQQQEVVVAEEEETKGGGMRADLSRVLKERHRTTDDGRIDGEKEGGKFSQRVGSRHAAGQLTARENVSALLDEGLPFLEYGRFAVAAQSGRLSVDELRERTPADGLITGVGSINQDAFGPSRSKVSVIAYDATVLAGTQGYFNHRKLDRMLEVTHTQRLPLVLYAEGGGGRPGDTDVDPIANSLLAVSSFRHFAKLSGRTPLIGLASGYCFAGNAALLGLCDVIIATKTANIGMAGPAMIAGGGLGMVKPTAIGPATEGYENGVVDLLVETEAEGAQVARRYLSYFQGKLSGDTSGWAAHDQSTLRDAVPSNRKRTYKMTPIIETLCDVDTFLELRGGYAGGVITGLGRVSGHPLGILANNPMSSLGGAVDSDGALKASRFMELCDSFGLPLLFLCDTPGFMVGVEHERTGAVRKLSRMFSVGSSLKVPSFTIVTRKAYGLGAMAMMGGQAVGENNTFHISWPTAEAGPMNLEGAVSLGFAKELKKAREEKGVEGESKLFNKLLAGGYERAQALSTARTLETDDVIDPAESRQWIVSGLEAAEQHTQPSNRPCVSPW